MLIFLKEEGIFPSPPCGLRGIIWGVTKSPHLESSILPCSSAHTHCWLLLTLIHFKYNFWSFSLHTGKTLMREALACRAGELLGDGHTWDYLLKAPFTNVQKKAAAPANTSTHLAPVMHHRITHLRGINGSQAVIYLPDLGIYLRKTQIAHRSVYSCSPITKQA